ncbi:MAG: hypothetical protein BMS9Abin02_1988 [Anaerolineae bacterium]|nr:MAG: hypothetical protein BMS9Abin02_1988 [Anaerolineae bacterium]
MTIKMMISLVGLVTTLSGAGWWASQTLATNDRVDEAEQQTKLVESKADYSLDIHIQSLMAQIERIRAKVEKSPDDYEQIRYLRGEIARIRRMKSGAVK